MVYSIVIEVLRTNHSILIEIFRTTHSIVIEIFRTILKMPIFKNPLHFIVIKVRDYSRLTNIYIILKQNYLK